MASVVSPTIYTYTTGERNTVILLVVSGLISFAALVGLFGLMIFMSRRYKHTHFQAYFVCLLLANTMQAWGTTISLKWVLVGAIEDDSKCAMQGGLTQGGNIGSAIWSFIISWHLFNLLFLRYKTPKLISWGMIFFGWSFVFFIVFLGPVVIQTPARGHYFGISGLWCWITPAYHTEQIWLEYFFQILSLSVNFFMHIATWLRVRGNLLRVDGRWRMRFVPLGDSWQLSLGRDFTDSTMLRLAQHMIWYPVAYAATTLPMGIARMAEICGMDVSLPVAAVTGFIFNLGGFVNVVLFLGARRIFPDADSIPEFTERKEGRDVDAIVAQFGVVPFTLTRTPSEVSEMTVSSFDSIAAAKEENARGNSEAEGKDEHGAPAKDKKDVDTDTNTARRPDRRSRASIETLTLEPAVLRDSTYLPERVASRRPFSASRPPSGDTVWSGSGEAAWSNERLP